MSLQDGALLSIAVRRVNKLYKLVQWLVVEPVVLSYSSHDGGRVAYHDGNSATLQEEAMGSRLLSDCLESGADLPEERCGPCTRAAEGLKGHRMKEVSSVNKILVFSDL